MAEDWRWFIGIIVMLAQAFAGVIRNLYASSHAAAPSCTSASMT